MSRRPSYPVPREAMKARIDAERASAYAEWQQENTRKLMESLREIRERNHFSEAINPKAEES